jgi:hypothetical protein
MVSKQDSCGNIAGSASLMVTGQAAIHPVILSAVVILLPYRMQNGSLAMVLLPGRLQQNTAVAHLLQSEQMVSNAK